MESEKLMLSIMSFVVGLPVMILARGYAIMSLWGWFVVPLGMPAIGVMHGAGLGALALFVTYTNADVEGNDDVPAWKTIGRSLLLSLVCLAFGAAYHALMVL